MTVCACQLSAVSLWHLGKWHSILSSQLTDVKFLTHKRTHTHDELHSDFQSFPVQFILIYLHYLR